MWFLQSLRCPQYLKSMNDGTNMSELNNTFPCNIPFLFYSPYLAHEGPSHFGHLNLDKYSLILTSCCAL